MFKKGIFIAIFLGFVAISPAYIQTVHAQTVTSTPTIEEQYITALTQIIALLQQQVNSLLIQLADVQKTQTDANIGLNTKIDTISTQVSQIQQNTIPSFGSVPFVTPQVDKEIKIEAQINQQGTRLDSSNHYANIIYDVFANYTENGQDVIGIPITISSSDSLGKFAGGFLDIGTTTKTTIHSNGCKPIGFTGICIQFIPTATSTSLSSNKITLTATANGVSASTDVYAQIPSNQ